MSPADRQRSRVYAAETFVRTMFDRAAEHGSRDIDFLGTRLTLPPEARFGALPDVQRYIDRVMRLPGVQGQWPQAGPLMARGRKGQVGAHYERRGGTGVIAVPTRRDGRWSLRELVVLHEIAHHLSDTEPPHGPDFTATFCSLAETVMGPEAGYLLRVVFAEHGVR